MSADKYQIKKYLNLVNLIEGQDKITGQYYIKWKLADGADTRKNLYDIIKKYPEIFSMYGLTAHAGELMYRGETLLFY